MSPKTSDTPRSSKPSKSSKSSKDSKASKHSSSSKAIGPPAHCEVRFQLQTGGRSVKFNVPLDGNCYRAYLVHSCGHNLTGTVTGDTVTWTVQTYRDHDGECTALGHEFCDYKCVDKESVCDACQGKIVANPLEFAWNA